MSGTDFDAVIVGAGAAGLHCAAMAGQLGARVLLLDHAAKVAEKIRISGGGRCNFTNRDATPANFLSENPHFCRSALARYTPADFLALVDRHRIPWHEKHKGQLFCDRSAEDIIAMLLAECAAGGVERRQPCTVKAVRRAGESFELDTDSGTVRAARLVVATGGLSIPKIGASDFGLRLATQFGHRVVPTRPGLVPLTFDSADWAPFVPLAGVSLEVGIEAGRGKARGRFVEDLLFTHRGLSGPAVLQASNYWREGEPLRLDLAQGHDLADELLAAKQGSRRQLGTELAERLPRRLAEAWLAARPGWAARPLAEMKDAELRELAGRVQAWEITPDGSEGYRKAEVMLGGVDTRELNQQTLESRLAPGLHFIGEVVDVTGWLGGYNFQWAWASAAACARGLVAGLQGSGSGI
ncbi:MAG: NAD(P)/FAD-dependent oxidoreductase [Piscinibacter sp.]|uniref:NAD(P)/FAD-dependent oxidoreductase n=1 Tax=Piscinibacter sp. TaxID=1903157 RepID=UPI003D0FB86A